MARWLVLIEIETEGEEQPDIQTAAKLALDDLRFDGTPYNVIRHPAEA